MAPAAIASLLSLIPSAIQALSQLVSNIRQKRPAGEIVGDAVDTLSDLSGVIGKTLPYDDGHPVREALDLLPMVATVTADGRVTRQEGLALGESLARSGADVLAWAQTLPDDDADETPAAASVVLARGTAKRRQARMHARPQGQGRKPIHPSALVASKPQPPALPSPALPTSWPFGRPVGAVFGDATGRPPLPSRDKTPGATLPTERPKVPGGELPVDPEDTADVPPPVVEVPPVVAEPPPSQETRPLAGTLRIARMVHFDGMDRPGCDIMALCAAMVERDAMLRAADMPELWALTGPQVRQIEAAWPGLLASLRPGALATREPHKGMGTAADGLTALAEAGVQASPVLGSAVDPEDYIGGVWPIIVTGAQPGHVRDTKESGFVRIAPGYVSCQSAATASSSQKSGVARKVADGSLPWGFEVMSISAMDPQLGAPFVAEDGSRHYFGTPQTKDRDDHPDVASVPAEVAWGRMIEGAGGAADRILLTTFWESVAAAMRAGVLDATGSALYASNKS